MPPPAINLAMTPRQWGELFALSVLWGGSFFFIGVAVRELPPVTIVTTRLILAALILYAVARASGVAMPKGWRPWLGFSGLGLLNNALPFCLFAWGQMHITGGLASILNATTPLFTVFVAHALTRDEKMSAAHVVGAIIGLIGVAAMIGGDFTSLLGANVLAQLACLVASISYAFGGVFGRRAANVEPLAAATAQLTMAAAMLVPVMLIVDQPWTLPQPSWGAVGAIAGQAVLSTAVAYVVFFRLLATAGANNVALVTFLNPITAFLLGALFLGERLELQHVAGMGVIVLGFAIIDGRPWKALVRR